MEYSIDWKKGILNPGSQKRIRKAMRRAAAGKVLRIGFIGGSITQGSLSSRPELCYAYRVFSWWKSTFPNAEFTYINAGIGGTTSQFGVARAESDLLAYKPDFVIVEFSVNDENTEHFQETYEGLVRRIYDSITKPAVLLVHNMYYDTGKSAQQVHEAVGKHYHIPCLSVRDSIYQKILQGKLDKSALTTDDLHPNDEGHALVAALVTDFLQEIRQHLDEIEEQHLDETMPEAITKNRYQISTRYQNDNILPECYGFQADLDEQTAITDCFKKGWYASNVGSTICFHVQGQCIGIQYRRSVQHPAPIAEIVIDGKKAAVLDANFDEDWGDKLELVTVLEEDEIREHVVEVRIVEAQESLAWPFYLVSVITA